jgi:phage-related protein
MREEKDSKKREAKAARSPRAARVPGDGDGTPIANIARPVVSRDDGRRERERRSREISRYQIRYREKAKLKTKKKDLREI